MSDAVEIDRMIARRIADRLRRKAVEYRKGDKPQMAEGCDEDAEALDRLAASPSVGGWEGSRPQEAVPTEGPGAAVLALKEIIPAVEAYLMSGDDLAQALKRQTWGPALKRARQRAAEGCSSNEGADA